MSRLDMSHGFVKYITKNQIDRDNFEKIHRKSGKTQTTSSKNRRPAQAVYTPPHKLEKDHLKADMEAGKGQENKGVDGAEANECQKVQVSFKDHEGKIHHFFVHKGDNQVEVAAKFCTKMKYGDEYITPLAKRIADECSPYFTA